MIYVREEVCIGCTLCEVHCSVEHSASRSIVAAFKAEETRPLARIRVGKHPDGFLPAQCRHCADAPCVAACLAGALTKDPATGIVDVDPARCIGCWACILVCPYGAIRRDQAHNIIAKCDLCPGREVPACVANCPNEALLSDGIGPRQAYRRDGWSAAAFSIGLRATGVAALPEQAIPTETKYLIIGNSAGGIAAAEAIREVDRQGSITILSEEPYPPYSRPAISHYLAGERSLDGILLRPAHFYEANKVHLTLGARAVGLDTQARHATLSDGRMIAWHKLLLATGGSPIIPPIKGADTGRAIPLRGSPGPGGLGMREGIFTFTTLADAEGLRAAVGPGDTVVVIGGGLIGVSVAEGLAHRGARVVVVELLDRLLGMALDREASDIVAEALQRQGIELALGQTALEIVGPDGRVGGVVLKDGRTVSCRAVVIAVGVAPRTELAAGTPIAVNRGIVVDRRMATTCRDVYACGDAAEAYDFVRQESRLMPVWPNAIGGGRIAGYNMAGRRATYDGSTGMTSFSYFGLSVVSAGLLEHGEGEGYEVLSTTSQERGLYRKLVLKDGRIVGLIFVGSIEASGIAYGLMKGGVDVGPFKEALLAEDISLAALPVELRRQRLPVAPPEGLVPVQAGDRV